MRGVPSWKMWAQHPSFKFTEKLENVHFHLVDMYTGRVHWDVVYNWNNSQGGGSSSVGDIGADIITRIFSMFGIQEISSW